MNTDAARAAIASALAAIAPEIDLADVADDARLRDDLDLDSMDFLSLVQELSDRTGVEIPEADYGLVETLGGLEQYLVQRSTAAAGV